jgi:hypothetical protein
VFTRASVPGSLPFTPNEFGRHSVASPLPVYSPPWTTWPLAIVIATEVSPIAFAGIA